MLERNTPLINQLLLQISTDPNFETWKLRGNTPLTLVARLCESLKADPRFAGQPSRFFISAIPAVDYIYRSWFALLKDLRMKLAFRESRLALLVSDAELVEQCGQSLDIICVKATEILTQVNLREQPETKSQLFNLLLKKYRAEKNDLVRCALLHLYKESVSSEF